MKSLKKIALVFSCMALLGVGSAFAADVAQSSPLDEVQANPEVMRAPGTYVTRGEIVAVENGMYIIKGEGSRNMVAAIVIASNPAIALLFMLSSILQTLCVEATADATSDLHGQ